MPPDTVISTIAPTNTNTRTHEDQATSEAKLTQLYTKPTCSVECFPKPNYVYVINQQACSWHRRKIIFTLPEVPQIVVTKLIDPPPHRSYYAINIPLITLIQWSVALEVTVVNVW